MRSTPLGVHVDFQLETRNGRQARDRAAFFSGARRCSSQAVNFANGQVLITDRASIQPRRA